MTIYLNVSARRIQSWIVRTPRLKFIRGASIALAETTADESINQWLRGSDLDSQLQIARDAGHVDGVVTLRVKDPTMPLALDGRPYVTMVWRLISHLQHRLPGVEWGGWVAEAPSYVEAYANVSSQDSRPSPHQIRSFPADVALPLARSCESCEQELQTTQVEVENEDDDWASARPDPIRVKKRTLTVLGPDCATRLAAARRYLSEPEGPGSREAWGFPELATLGAPPSPAMNHLATIAADGNRMGELFDAILSLPPKVRSEATQAVTNATAQAVAGARRAVGRHRNDEKPLPDIPHYIGGDDILVSVPARLAWPYAAKLAEEFEHQLSSEWDKIADNANLEDPERAKLAALLEKTGLGIGVVFAHHSYPFWMTYQLAEAAVRLAKHSAGGRHSAVSWVNLTVEEHLLPYRTVDAHGLRLRLRRTAPASLGADTQPAGEVPLDSAGQKQDQVLTSWTSSQRQTALSILRDEWQPGEWPFLSGPGAEGAGTARNIVVTERLVEFSDRHHGLLWPELINDSAPASDEQLALLSNLLSMQSWWPQS